MPVTHKEGDRYPLGPPDIFHSSTAVVQLTVNQLVVGSIPACGASFRIHSAKNYFHFLWKKEKYPVVFSPCGVVAAFVFWGHEVGVRFSPRRPVFLG
jgi:hypothetical protein